MNVLVTAEAAGREPRFLFGSLRCCRLGIDNFAGYSGKSIGGAVSKRLRMVVKSSVIRERLVWAGRYYATGVAIYLFANWLMRQFRQGTALGLYGVVGSNIPRYVWGNLFILFGMVFIAIALKATTTVTKNRYGLIGDLALGLSLLLWFCELFGRIFMTTFIAQAVLFHSMPVPTTFPMTVGVGREPLLISSTLLMLLAISLVTWSLQCSGFLSKQWSQLTIGLILASGMGGLFLSRNAGGTERAVLYALVVVVLLLAGWTLRTAKA